MLGVVRWPIELCDQPEVGGGPLAINALVAGLCQRVVLWHLLECFVETIAKVKDGPVLLSCC